jgi:hypothetical protein
VVPTVQKPERKPGMGVTCTVLIDERGPVSGFQDQGGKLTFVKDERGKLDFFLSIE